MKIYLVYNEEEYVGSFFQAAFSTHEKAETYIMKRTMTNVGAGIPARVDLSIEEYEIDSEEVK